MVMEDSVLPPALATTLRTARVKHVPGGQIILYEEDVPHEVYVLKRGVVKIYDINDQGNEKILHLVKPPAVIPFAFFSGQPHPLKWFYAALTDCDVYVLSALQLTKAVTTNGALGQLLTNTFSEDVHELLVRLSSLSKTHSRDKLIAALKFLAACHSVPRRSGWWRVNFAASHQLLADLCGITRESAAMVMKELQDQKIVRYPRLTILEINQAKLLKEP
jgi:CRP/FNR family transcriptional regulator